MNQYRYSFFKSSEREQHMLCIIYIGWIKIPLHDHELTRLIEDYEETLAELLAIQQRIDLAIVRYKMFEDDEEDIN